MTARIAVLIAIGITLISPGAQGSEVDATVAKDAQEIERALAASQDAIMALPGVVGTGISLCESELCIKVLVSDDSPGLRQQLDEILCQHHYVVEQTDPVRSLPAGD